LRGLTTRNLINVGIFTVLYFAAVAVFGQLGALVPILQVLGPLYIPIVAGIPFTLMLALGYSANTISLLALVLAPAADLICRAGEYRRWPYLVAGYALFSLMLIGTVVPLFFAREAFLERIGQRHDAAWVQSMIDLTPSWMFAVMLAMLVVGAVIGAQLGRAVLRKHFERAGIA